MMGNIGLYGAVHMETCGKGNGNGVVINWVLCPTVMTTSTTVSFTFAAVTMNEH